MVLIPENTIEEILSRVDIVELISGYIPLKRAGRSYRALCPFHSEKTPSFMVNPERQIFHCFGCSAGGNAFGFVMRYERLEFPEAVELLAKKAGVVLPKAASGARSSQSQSILTQLYKINELAANLYFEQLYSAQGETALKYLTKRAVSKDSIEKFKLGFAFDRWDGLLNYLRGKDIPLGLIEKAGLIIPKDKGGYYDRFRNRLIVPILDTRNRVLGFGARVLDESLPKYVNSPETPVYSKGKILFGLNSSYEAIRLNDSAIIVEGYIDLITPYQAGFKNIVASCGTALTLEQLRLIKRYTNNVVMVYDSDNAGMLATVRSLDLLIEEGLNVQVAGLPEGYDPDGYVRRLGPDKFRELLEKAKDIFDYKMEILKSKYSRVTIANKANIASEMLPTISKFSNMVLKSAYLKKLAEALKVDESSLWSELKKVNHARGYSATRKEKDSSTGAGPLRQPLLASSTAERLLVKLMLEETEFIAHLREKISPADFKDRSLSQIVSRMFELFSAGKKIDAKCLVSQCVDPQAAQTICELLASDYPQQADRARMLEDCLSRMKGDSRKLKQQELCEQMKLAQVRKDEFKLRELLAEFQYLSKRAN
jgi:DNA primase